MRKMSLGISLLVGLGLAGTASADDLAYAADGYYTNDSYAADGYAHVHDASCDHDNDGYADYGDASWITPTLAIPVAPQVVVQPRRGYVWVEGRWTWTGYEWTWAEGYWVRARPDYVYIQGRWDSDGHRHRWISGRWDHRPRVIVRNPVRYRDRHVTHTRVVRDVRRGNDHARRDRWDNRDHRGRGEWRGRDRGRDHDRGRDQDRGRGRGRGRR